MKSKPPLSFWQIWNMCFGFLGIQFGFALQNANVSRIFQTLGANVGGHPDPVGGRSADRTDRAADHRALFGPHLEPAGPAPTLLRRPARCWPRWRCWRCPTRRCCGSRRACCGSWTPRSTSRWSRSARSSATSCRRASARWATPCRACSSASARVVASLLPWLLAHAGRRQHRGCRAHPRHREYGRSTSAARCCWSRYCGRYCPRANTRPSNCATSTVHARPPQLLHGHRSAPLSAWHGCWSACSVRWRSPDSTWPASCICWPAWLPVFGAAQLWLSRTRSRGMAGAGVVRSARHAARHAAAGLGAVLLLVRPVRHVDLRHSGSHRGDLPHHRHRLGGLQRGRQLGRRAVWRSTSGSPPWRRW